MRYAFHRFHFTGQRENEEVIEVIHRHWLNINLQFLMLFFFTAVTLGVMFILPFFFPVLLGAYTVSLFHFVENTFFLCIWIFSFLIWIDYYFDVWIITNERIVNIEQKGLFNRYISELNFRNIQDVATVVEGIVPTMFNFGEVSVQTAAEQERFLFHMVPDPYRIKDIIMKLSEQTKGNLQ